MKLKHLVLLVMVAALLAAWAYWRAQQASPTSPTAIGEYVLPRFPLNDVSKIIVTAPEGALTVAKIEGTWRVLNRWNYPAKFDKVADCLQDLRELKIGQVLALTEAQRGEFKLLAPTNATPDATGQTGTLVELRDARDGLLASLLIGKHFMRRPAAQRPEAMMAFGGYPDGQYIQTMNGRVVLVSKTLDRLLENAKTWLNDDFIHMPAAEIQTITVSGPDRAPITLTRAKEGETFALEGLKPEDGAADSAKISQMSGALNHLGFDDVVAPTLTSKETGLDKPIRFSAVTKQGQTYIALIGNSPTNDAFDRYAQVQVAYEPTAAATPADTNAAAIPPKAGEEKGKVNLADETKALNEKLGPWTFTLKSYRAEALLLKREDLIKKPEPPKTEPPAGIDKPAEPPDKSAPKDQAAPVENKTAPDTASTTPVKSEPSK